MTRLIPEKTVELWTALALEYYLGPNTWIWSWSSGADQDVWAPADLRKWFMLELKAPEEANRPHISINLEQLKRYVKDHGRGLHPDVLYVMPSPPVEIGPTSPQDAVTQKWDAAWSCRPLLP